VRCRRGLRLARRTARHRRRARLGSWPAGTIATPWARRPPHCTLTPCTRWLNAARECDPRLREVSGALGSIAFPGSALLAVLLAVILKDRDGGHDSADALGCLSGTVEVEPGVEDANLLVDDEKDTPLLAHAWDASTPSEWPAELASLEASGSRPWRLRWPAMLAVLTVQQQAERCTCGRYLAWPRTRDGFAPPWCCRCMRPPAGCTCEPTSEPAEGCHAADLGQVAEPLGADPDCE
jgi:hypothetical protein